MADINELISKEAIAQIEKLERLIDQVAKNMGDVFEATKQANQILSGLKSPSLDELTKKQKDAVKSAEELTKAEKELQKAQESLEKQRQKAYEQLAKQEAKEREHKAILNGEAKTIDELRQKNAALAKERNRVNVTTEEGRKQVKLLNSQIDENNKLITANSDELSKQKINIGNYKSAFGGLVQSFMQGEVGIKEFTKQVWKMSISLMTNPIVLIIAAIVGSLTLLYNAFKKSDEGGTLIAARFEQLKSVVSVIIQRIGSFASGLTALFSGNWSEAATKMKIAFTGISQQISEATKAAKEYIYALDQLEDEEVGYISERAKNERKIAELEFMAQNKELSYAVRKKALQDAIRISQEQVEKEKSFALSRYEIELNNAAAKYNINVRYLRQFIEADDEAQNVLLANNQKLMQARNNMNDEGQKNLEDLYAAFINLDTKYFNENKRNISKLTAFEEAIRKEKEEKEKQSIKEKETASKIKVSIEEQQERELNMIAQDAAIEATKQGQKVLEITQQIADAEVQIEKNKNKQKLDEERAHLELLKQYRYQAAQEGVAALLQLSSALNERELQNLEERYKQGKITEEEYNRDVAKIKLRQARFDRTQTLLSIAMDTAAAIMKTVKDFPLTGGLPWSAIIAAIGATQAAAVLAQPLPKFASGTNYSPEGLAIVGERGREIIEDPMGVMSLTGDGAHLTYLKRGSKIIPNKQTEQMLSFVQKESSSSTGLISKQNKEILRKLSSIKQVTIVPGKNKITERNGNFYREYLNTKLN